MTRFFKRQLLRESFRSFTLAERILFYVATGLLIASGITAGLIFGVTRTVGVPAVGGSYTEAVIGGPRFINPALAPANDADRDLVRLVYSGLMRNNADGAIIPDLASSYSVSTDSRTFVFILRDGVKWHDNVPLTVDDVLFTFHLIQNSEYQSPLRFAWQGVKVEKKDEHSIGITLQNPYASFLSLTTVGILPQHIWQDVSPQAFGLSDLNLKPVGSGPFRFRDIQRQKDGTVTAITLERNASFYRRPAYLSTLTFRFFEESRDDALASFMGGNVDGIGLASLDAGTVLDRKGAIVHALNFPRIFSVFFNQNQSNVFAKKEVREALAYATDRNKIRNDIYGGKADIAYTPLPPSVLGYTDDVQKRDFDKDKAASILEKAGWKLDESGVRILKETNKQEQLVKGKKILSNVVTTTTLEFTLLTANLPELQKTAELLKNEWEAIGARVDVDIAGVADIQGERVRPRQYDAVLFGYVLGIDPDPFSFWHSSQRRDPGLNLALYQNPKADKLLEEARQTTNAAERKKKLGDFQKIVADDVPAIFLVSPEYLFAVSSEIKNIGTATIANPAERFSNAENWYRKTRRAFR